MIFRPTLWLSQNLLKASNESRRRIKVSAVALAMFILIVSVGTIVGDVMGGRNRGWRCLLSNYNRGFLVAHERSCEFIGDRAMHPPAFPAGCSMFRSVVVG